MHKRLAIGSSSLGRLLATAIVSFLAAFPRPSSGEVLPERDSMMFLNEAVESASAIVIGEAIRDSAFEKPTKRRNWQEIWTAYTIRIHDVVRATCPIDSTVILAIRGGTFGNATLRSSTPIAPQLHQRYFFFLTKCEGKAFENYGFTFTVPIDGDLVHLPWSAQSITTAAWMDSLMSLASRLRIPALAAAADGIVYGRVTSAEAMLASGPSRFHSGHFTFQVDSTAKNVTQERLGPGTKLTVVIPGAHPELTTRGSTVRPGEDASGVLFLRRVRREWQPLATAYAFWKRDGDSLFVDLPEWCESSSAVVRVAAGAMAESLRVAEGR